MDKKELKQLAKKLDWYNPKYREIMALVRYCLGNMLIKQEENWGEKWILREMSELIVNELEEHKYIKIKNDNKNKTKCRNKTAL